MMRMISKRERESESRSPPIEKTAILARAAQDNGECRENDANPSRAALAHAPAAVPRSGDAPVHSAVDQAARTEGLLGHGAGARGISGGARDVQSGAVAGSATGGIRERKI